MPRNIVGPRSVVRRTDKLAKSDDSAGLCVGSRSSETTPLSEPAGTCGGPRSSGTTPLSEPAGAVVAMVALEDLVEDLVGTVRDGTHRV